MVANRTESAPQLMDEVTRRARDGWEIALVVPPERHPDHPDWTPEEACRLVQRAAGHQEVTLVDHGDDAAATIGAMAERGECDAILLCTPREHHEHWHRHTLPKRLNDVGVPVTIIAPEDGTFMSELPKSDWLASQIGPST